MVVLSYLRLLQFLRYYKALGVLSIVLNNMIKDVLNFIAILLVFTLGFGFALFFHFFHLVVAQVVCRASHVSFCSRL